TQDYEALAKERNALVMREIKNINITQTVQLIPKKETEIKKIFESVQTYDELAQKRGELIAQNLQQELTAQQTEAQQKEIVLIQKQKQERVVLISLLVASLIS